MPRSQIPLLLLLLTLSNVHASEPVTLVVTADGEGHVHACDRCPGRKGLGGLARRATIVKALRHKTPDIILLDAGNSLFGAESTSSGGKVIVRAYEQLRYVALNVSYRDFRYGKDATLALAASSEVPFLSANLLDAQSGKPLFKPYEICRVGTRKVAVIGLTKRPVGIDTLPHLRLELAGIQVADPVETLAELLPKVKKHSDEIVLLYYGTIEELKKIDRRFSEDLIAIAMGGRRTAEIPRNPDVPIVASMNHGRALGILDLVADASVSIRVQLIDPDTAQDTAMEKALSGFPIFADRKNTESKDE